MGKMKLYIPFGGYLNKKGVMIYPYIYPTVVIALILLVLGIYHAEIYEIRTQHLCYRRQ